MTTVLRALEREIATLIIETLNLEEVTPEDIDPEGTLFGNGLGLDSIDALEIGAVLRQKYSIRLRAQSDDYQEHFRSLRALARFVEASADISGK